MKIYLTLYDPDACPAPADAPHVRVTEITGGQEHVLNKIGADHTRTIGQLRGKDPELRELIDKAEKGRGDMIDDWLDTGLGEKIKALSAIPEEERTPEQAEDLERARKEDDAWDEKVSQVQPDILGPRYLEALALSADASRRLDMTILRKAACAIRGVGGDWSLADPDEWDKGRPDWPRLDPLDPDPALDARQAILWRLRKSDLERIKREVERALNGPLGGLTEEERGN